MKPNRHPDINHLAQRIARLISSQSRQLTFLIALTLLITTFTAMAQQKKSSFADLTKFFAEWRAFQRPDISDGVPDYTARAMSAQHRELPAFQRRLAAIGASGWPIREQVDWHIVRAEMNGLDFDHRVLRPWANNPGFYVTVFFDQSDQPAREGPHAYGAVEIWRYRFPLSAERAAEMGAAIRIIPKLLEQARKNLVGKSRDLWIYGTKDVREQSSSLTRLATLIADAPGNSSPTSRGRRKPPTSLLSGWKRRLLQKRLRPGSAPRTTTGT